jgi:hypothetical protein
MKLILSRKGFEPSAGGVPSPNFPDGTMVSVPIPDKRSIIRYGDIATEHGPLGSIVEDLTDGGVPASHRAHIDPDVIPSSLPREPGWRALFGQTAAAQGHLRNKGVGTGDLFVFFGLFRRVSKVGGKYVWRNDSRPCHVIWGWFEVDEAMPFNALNGRNLAWAKYHPHFHRPDDTKHVVYIARKTATIFDGSGTVLPGAGAFRRYSRSLQLTDDLSDKVSSWSMPGWLFPGEARTPLSYHAESQRWERRGDKVILNSAARGQEFVLDCDQYPEAIGWAYDLIQNNEHYA